MKDKKFSSQTNKTDIIHQSEDGGGFKLSDDGKFIFGSKQQNIINQLIEENYTSSVDINANDQPFIAVMNNRRAVDINIGNKNIDTLMDPSEDSIIADLSKQLETKLAELKDIISPPLQDSSSTTNFLPDDELSYMESAFFNSVGSGVDGTGFEGVLSPEEIQKIINEVNNRNYNKE